MLITGGIKVKMNDIKSFSSAEFGTVRTVEINNEPYFVGKDVAEILGYSNASKAVIDRVDTDDKLTSQFSNSGQNRDMTVINESGLYSLILGSKLPTAKKFKHWVTSEVLPSIRKHGAYMTDNTIEQAITNPDFLIKLATELKTEKQKRELLERKVVTDKPKVLFANAVSVANTSILIGELAKILKQNGVNIGQNRLFEWLRTNGYLISRQGTDRNMPTQRAMEIGLFEIKETVVAHADGHTTISKTPKVTGRGQVYFVNKFIGGTANA